MSPQDAIGDCTCQIQKTVDMVNSMCNDLSISIPTRMLRALKRIIDIGGRIFNPMTPNVLPTVIPTLIPTNTTNPCASILPSLTKTLNNVRDGVTFIARGISAVCSNITSAQKPLMNFLGCWEYRMECLKVQDVMAAFNPMYATNCSMYPKMIMDSVNLTCSSLMGCIPTVIGNVPNQIQMTLANVSAMFDNATSAFQTAMMANGTTCPLTNATLVRIFFFSITLSDNINETLAILDTNFRQTKPYKLFELFQYFQSNNGQYLHMSQKHHSI